MFNLGTENSPYILKNAIINRWGTLSGNVYNNPNFTDGELVHTSTIVENIDNTIVKTRNSVYKVETWLEEPKGKII